MEVAERKLAHKTVRIPELFLAFTGKSDDDIGADRYRRDAVRELPNQLPEKDRPVRLSRTK